MKLKIKNHRINLNRFIPSIVIAILIVTGVVFLIQELVKDYNNSIESVLLLAEQDVGLIEEIILNQVTYYDIALSEELQLFTWNQCEYMGISNTLELALLKKESNFNGQAVSYNNTSRGIGQLGRATAKHLSETLQIKDFNIFNEQDNIACSVYHLWELREHYSKQGYSDEELFYTILGAYNRGIKGFDDYVKENGTIETDYANDILKLKMELELYGKFI